MTSWLYYRCNQLALVPLLTLSCLSSSFAADFIKPNIVLVMSDDQGWGDVAYNGNDTVLTPELDRLSLEGVRLDRFYAAAPVCSPTRASVLTGRHPFRYGIEWAGLGHLPAEELTIAEILRHHGYATGHFGKWHVGELSRTVNQSYFTGDLADPAHYSPPWENGFDVSFSTESMMPTYNPYYHVGGDYGSDDYRHLQSETVELDQRTGGFRWRDHYWTDQGVIVDEWLTGDDSKLITNRALDFIDAQIEAGKPFLALVWYHTPHTPLVAAVEDRAPYSDLPMEAQHWFGAISAMDREIGRLRSHLRERDVSDNTLFWFKSDNGPSYIHDYNSAGPFSGKKATLKEGGIRVPAIIEWPASIPGKRAVDAPISTSDILPTLLAAAAIVLPTGAPELDGENVLPLLRGDTNRRHKPIAFQSPIRGAKYGADRSRRQYALSGERYKLYTGDAGDNWLLFDLKLDPAETRDLADQHPEIVATMQEELMRWVERVQSDSR
ncbi:MAG: sulfatase-like hydrolase/transferase [Halioglobus sp.]